MFTYQLTITTAVKSPVHGSGAPAAAGRGLSPSNPSARRAPTGPSLERKRKR
jgi:hypothetical protein